MSYSLPSALRRMLVLTIVSALAASHVCSVSCGAASGAGSWFPDTMKMLSSMHKSGTALAILISAALLPDAAFAHTIAAGDQGYVGEITGVHLLPFAYLGAKHMVTGYDHLLFLFGVIFFLYRARDIAIYVSLFAIGHSTTMLLGVYFDFGINSYLIDAVIGLSVVYKSLDNMGAFQRWLGFQPNTKAATLFFGLCHGLGLSTKILDYEMAEDGLLANLLAFNVGVEIGQLLALAVILIGMSYWRGTANFSRNAYTVNVVVMSAGFLLIGYQLAGYVAYS